MEMVRGPCHPGVPLTAADAVPIVFLHGTRSSAGQRSTQLAALRDAFPLAAAR